MREFKFRVFDKERKLYVPQGEVIFFNYGDTRTEVNPNCLEYAYQTIKQENFIIEQFTGHRDADGKEVYEGDIFIDDDEVLVCQWEPLDACFVWAIYNYPMWFNEGGGEEYGNERDLIETVAFSECEDYKIVGNIYENPELLK